MMRAVYLLSSAAAALATAIPAKKGPQIWEFLGMPFEAASMVAALFGCGVTRVIIGQKDRGSRWTVRVPVDVLTIGTTFFVTMERRPEGLAALATGIFIGTLGATIIKIAEGWGNKMLQVIFPDAARSLPAAPEVEEGHEHDEANRHDH